MRDGNLREREECIELCDDAGGLLDLPCGVADFLAQALEDFELEIVAAFLGVKDDFFLLLQLGGDEALGAGEGLFANPLGGDFGAVAVADFEVVAEDAVEADLQVGDAGAVGFALTQRGDPGFGIGGELAQLIELWIVALLDQVTFAHGERRGVDDGAG